MLKTTGLSDKPALSRNNNSRSASNRNDNSKPVSKKNNSNGKVDRFGIGKNGIEHAKKSRKLSKSRKPKNKKMSKSQNLAKSEKKLSKNGNSTNFDTTKDGPKFLTPNARTAFNHLWLAFTEALILQYFDLKCHIWIEIKALGFFIGTILSQLTSGINHNEIVTKTNLSQ